MGLGEPDDGEVYCQTYRCDDRRHHIKAGQKHHRTRDAPNQHREHIQHEAHTHLLNRMQPHFVTGGAGELVPTRGIEPRTRCLKGSRSTNLSYGGEYSRLGLPHSTP